MEPAGQFPAGPMFMRHRHTLPPHATDALRARSLTRPEKAPRFGMSSDQDANVRKNRRFFVYIMTNRPRSHVLYTGITGNLPNRVFQHKNKLIPGFTSRYNLTRLVYYEAFAYRCSNRWREGNQRLARREKDKAHSIDEPALG